jgi:hypothetical protein
VILLASFPVVAYLVLQLPALQSWAAQRAVHSLSQGLDAEISIEKVYIVFFNKLIVKNISICTSPQDTLFHARKVSLSFSSFRPQAHKIRLQRIGLEDGVFHLEILQEHTNLEQAFRLQKDRDSSLSTSAKGPAWDISAQRFRMKNFRFTLKDDRRSRKGLHPHTMDFMDLDVRQISIDARQLALQNDSLSCQLRSLSCVEEKTGYQLHELSGAVGVSGQGAHIQEMRIQDPYSDIRATEFHMHYKNAKAFKHFLDSVVLESHFNKAQISFRSLAYYAPALQDFYLNCILSGHIRGPVRHLTGRDVQMSTASQATHLSTNFRIDGLPSLQTTTAFLDISHLESETDDVMDILAQINNNQNPSFAKHVPSDIPLHFQGSLAGLLNDFAVHGNMKAGTGDIVFDAVFRQEAKPQKGFYIDGMISTIDLDAGKLSGIAALGTLSMHSRARLLFRNAENGGINASIDSLRINRLDLKDYPYSNIFAVGHFQNRQFDGRIVCRDPNLNFIFQGLANLDYRVLDPDQDARYDFAATIAHADLDALGLDTRDSISHISGNITANFTRNILGDIMGEIKIPRLFYENSTGHYPLDNILFQSQFLNNAYRFELTAPFAKALYTGNQGLTTFVKDIQHHILYRHFPNYFAPVKGISEARTQDYQFNIEFLDVTSIEQLLLPGLFIADGSNLSVHLGPEGQSLMHLQSPYLRFKGQRAQKLDLRMQGDSSQLQGSFSALECKASGMPLDSLSLNYTASNNLLDINLNYSNLVNQNREGHFFGQLAFRPGQTILDKPFITLHIHPSHFLVDTALWELRRADIDFSPHGIRFHNLKLSQKEQSLGIHGVLAKTYTDTLHFELQNFDISLLNLFLENSAYHVAGNFTGNAQIVDFYEDLQFSADLKGHELYLNQHEVGELALLCRWDHPQRRFRLAARNQLKESVPLSIMGYYRPSDKELNLSASLKELSTIHFAPLLRSLVSGFDGKLSGELQVQGPWPKLSLTGNKVFVKDLDFTVNFTQVAYRLNSPIICSVDGVRFQNGNLSDAAGKTALVNGGLSHKHFRDIGLDVHVDFENFECLATTEKDNSSFYGSVFASGQFRIGGNLQQVLLDINARTERNSALHVPLSGVSEAQQSALLSFVPPPSLLPSKPLDPLDIRTEAQARKSPTQVAVKLEADLTPDAELFVEINKSTGDIISGLGSGAISIELDPVQDRFDIFGDYTVDQGNYLFVLQNFLSKRFTIQQGGQISFNGDILRTNINLTAAYKTKASIGTLLSDTTSVSNRRDVACLIHMTGNLTNPSLEFDIQIDDIAPEAQARVRSALTPEDKLIRQFMALLVSGSFMPDQQSGIVNNINILYSNASEILSNQLNTVFNQLNIPLDIGFNYQAGSQGQDLFDVAISTQLFNNRVIVNGNVGNSQVASKAGDVVGDIDIEVKLTDRGNFRVKAFSHSADQYSNYLDNTQRNGVGFVYQDEFSTFRELWQRLFVRKKKREARQALEQQYLPPE